MNQIALPLDTSSSFEDGSFIVTAANAELNKQLQNWQNWPNQSAILVGPACSGKSNIAVRFKLESGGYAADDAADIAQDELFHLWNRAKEETLPLLMVSSRPVSEWGIALPDLKSRLASSLLLEIPAPDDALVAGLLQKYFTLRGLSISEDALSYLGKRIDRTYENIQFLAQLMDSLAIERKKPVTRDIAKTALLQHETYSSEEDDFVETIKGMREN